MKVTRHLTSPFQRLFNNTLCKVFHINGSIASAHMCRKKAVRATSVRSCGRICLRRTAEALSCPHARWDHPNSCKHWHACWAKAKDPQFESGPAAKMRNDTKFGS
ncbi:hypothetical protein TRVL_09321 [Trypanosoma vivax]|nr:hypothetical protein TRVL_09321 [Trypanosoma vivax]